MRTLTIFLLLIGFMQHAFAQTTPFKHHEDKPFVQPQPLQISKDLRISSSSNRLGNQYSPKTLNSIHTNHEAVKSFRISTSGSMWIDMHDNHLWGQRSSVSEVIEKIIPTKVQSLYWTMEWTTLSEDSDAQNVKHIRVQQTLAGIPIHRQDMILHIEKGELRDMNGFAWTGPVPKKIPAPVSKDEALAAVRSYLLDQNVSFQSKPQFEGINHPQDEANLVWYPVNGNLTIAYKISMHPNMMDHWTVFIDASTFKVIEGYSELCSLAPLHLFNMPSTISSSDHQSDALHAGPEEMSLLLMDGPTVVSDQDLLGQNRTVNAYLVGSNFFMIDASRNGMFQSTQSVMPNEPVGVIWTIDADNGSPSLPNFQLSHITNTNNNWNNLEVSSHFNGGEAYEYFRTKFNRNSINGDGGNIVSIINVTDENGNDMDNAFWNGTAMFYGNGDVAFNAPLAKALDVAGHEMSHGVIQNTANLEYVGQSGALNESYADVFGAMIDRDDWKMGEDVSNPAVFSTGALRDLSNPNNGGTMLGDPGWQPKHMNEYQNLPNTPAGDNGGVHVNSGIPNRAFFLLATSIGKDKAEQIYYKALSSYLTKSSQFIDMRNAAEKAATDLHGTNSAEVVAVRSAFNGVGIGSGQGEDYEEDIEVNSGSDFILATDESESDLYWVPPGNPLQFVKMNVPAPISRPSFTDDGSACVYVDTDNNMILINFDWTSGLDYDAFYLEDNPQGIWRNVVVSKDGSKIAYTTSNLRNEISVFDFNTAGNEVYTLLNPTSAEGLTTGDVIYPDVLEWDYSGEYIMYDALNRIESTFGDGIEYWDVSFLAAWNPATNQFGAGHIDKLFSSLPENISIGNASFAKNSPYIITFDYFEDYYNIFGQIETDYRILAANIEAGELNEIYENNTVGYPSYSRLDDKILFTYDDNGSLLLATIDVQNANKTLPVAGSDVILITGAQKGVWFSTGNRIFTSTEAVGDADQLFTIQPQPANEFIKVSGLNMPENLDFQILDMTGRIISSGLLSDGKIILTGHLTPGTYLLRMGEKNDTLFNKRFVKL